MLTNQIVMLETLLNRSNASQDSQASDPSAMRSRQLVKDQLDKAKSALTQDDTEGAQQAINKARSLLFSDLRHAGASAVHDKLVSDFDTKLAGIESLRTAHSRIATEKNLSTEDTDSHINEQIGKAKSLRDKEPTSAIELLDGSLLTLKLSIARMRNGDTLVRDLNFSSKSEEYQYELDRNKTHFMLVDLLLQEKLSDSLFGKMVEKPLMEAKANKVQAQDLADQKLFDQAIKSLEDSTRQLIQVIRAAGIYIPG